MIPTWSVFVIVVVIVVVYILLSNTAKQRRRESVGGDFAKIPDFHANQVFTDIKGETAIGLDDRGRRIAVARKRAQPRTRVYSFSHIVSAEAVQNGAIIAQLVKGDHPEEGSGQGMSADVSVSSGETDSLFGSTRRPAPGAAPELKPLPGPLTSLGVQLHMRESSDPVVFIRFYEGKGVDLRSVAAEGALGRAQTLLGALDIAMRRAGLPPRPAISGSGLEAGS